MCRKVYVGIAKRKYRQKTGYFKAQEVIKESADLVEEK